MSNRKDYKVCLEFGIELLSIDKTQGVSLFFVDYYYKTT